MTTTHETRKHQINRLMELAQLSRKRFLKAGGNPKLSVGTLNNNDCLMETEKQELRDLFNQVVKDQEIAQYLQTKETWRDRLAVMKENR